MKHNYLKFTNSIYIIDGHTVNLELISRQQGECSNG